MRKVLGILSLISIIAYAGAQRVHGNFNVIGQTVLGVASEPHSSAVLDMSSSSDKGILPPVHTTSQRDAISSPYQGLFLFNSTTGTLDFYNASVWRSVATTVEVQDQNLINNLGLDAVDTADTDDSIRITAGDGSALSSSNVMSFAIASTTAGRFVTLEQTANVTIDLTGAHWGLGTNGDFTDVQLRGYGINDGGTAKYAICLKGGLRTITDTSTSTTATDINTKSECLVNTSLNSGTFPARELFWFNANFDDTSGSSEDLWAVQTGAGDLNVGIPVPDRTDWTTFTPNASNFSEGSTFGKWRRLGDSMEVVVRLTSDSSVAGNVSLDMPSGYIIETASMEANFYGAGICYANDATGGADSHLGTVYVGSSTTLVPTNYRAGGGVAWNASSPFTWASGDKGFFHFTVPILQWSANGN